MHALSSRYHAKTIRRVPVTTRRVFQFGFKASKTAIVLEILGLKWFQRFCFPHEGEELEEVIFRSSQPLTVYPADKLIPWFLLKLVYLHGCACAGCLCWVFMS